MANILRQLKDLMAMDEHGMLDVQGYSRLESLQKRFGIAPSPMQGLRSQLEQTDLYYSMGGEEADRDAALRKAGVAREDLSGQGSANPVETRNVGGKTVISNKWRRWGHEGRTP